MGSDDEVNRDKDIDEELEFYPDLQQQYGKADNPSLIFEPKKAQRVYSKPLHNPDRTIHSRPQMLLKDLTRRQ